MANSEMASNFLPTRLENTARRAFEDHQQLVLSIRDSKAFVEALIDAKPVNDRLRDTVRRYRKIMST